MLCFLFPALVEKVVAFQLQEKLCTLAVAATLKFGFRIRVKSVFTLFGGGAFLGPYPWHMEVPGLGVKSELQQPAYSHSNAGSELRL